MASRQRRMREVTQLKMFSAPSARWDRAPAQGGCLLYTFLGHRLWTRGSAACVAASTRHAATGLTEAAEDGARGRTQRRVRGNAWLRPIYRQIPRCTRGSLATATFSSSRLRRVRARSAMAAVPLGWSLRTQHRRVTPEAGGVRMVKVTLPHGRIRPAWGLRGSSVANGRRRSAQW